MHLTGVGAVESCEAGVGMLKHVATTSKESQLLKHAYKAVQHGQYDRAALQYLFIAASGHSVAQQNLAILADKERVFGERTMKLGRGADSGRFVDLGEED